MLGLPTRALLAAVGVVVAIAAPPPRAIPIHVDVVIFADNGYRAGVAAVINSSRAHSSAPLRFFVGFDGQPDALFSYLECVGVRTTDVVVRRPIEIVDRGSLPQPRLNKKNQTSDKARLSSAANYARFKIPATFPEVKIAWYFDADTLPIGNLAGPEHAAFVRSGHAIQPAIREGTIAQQFDPAVRGMYKKKTGVELNLQAPSWNAGVWLADFSQWDKLRVADDALFWVNQELQHEKAGLGHLWKLNTQPIMYLVFHNVVRRAVQFLSHGWNCESRDEEFDDVPPRGCKIIHWNGNDKPWSPVSNGHGLWKKYLPLFNASRCAGALNDDVVDGVSSDGDANLGSVLVETQTVTPSFSATCTVSPPRVAQSFSLSRTPTGSSTPRVAQTVSSSLTPTGSASASRTRDVVSPALFNVSFTAAPTTTRSASPSSSPSVSSRLILRPPVSLAGIPVPRRSLPGSGECLCAMDCGDSDSSRVRWMACKSKTTLKKGNTNAMCSIAAREQDGAGQLAVDIVLLSNANYSAGVAAVITAAREHTSVPVRVFVGFDGEPEVLYRYLACVGIDKLGVTIRRSIPLFDAGGMPQAADPARQRLQHPANYARFTIHKTFPELSIAWYLDVDTIPVSDLFEALPSFAASGQPIRPAARTNMPVSYAFHADFAAEYQAHYGMKFISNQFSYNGGVWLADFSQWERIGVAKEALFWINANSARVASGKPPFWRLATQPLLYAIFNQALKLSGKRAAQLVDTSTGTNTSAGSEALHDDEFLPEELLLDELDWHDDAGSSWEGRPASSSPLPPTHSPDSAAPEPRLLKKTTHALPRAALTVFLPRTWNCNGADACVSPLCRVLHWYHEDKPWEPKTPGHALWAAHLPRALEPTCLAILA